MSKVLASLKARTAAVAENKYETENITVVNVIVTDKFDYHDEEKNVHIPKVGIKYTIDGDESGAVYLGSVPTNTLKMGDPYAYIGSKCVATFNSYDDKEGNEQWGLSRIDMKANNAVYLASKGAMFSLQN